MTTRHTCPACGIHALGNGITHHLIHVHKHPPIYAALIAEKGIRP